MPSLKSYREIIPLRPHVQYIIPLYLDSSVLILYSNIPRYCIIYNIWGLKELYNKRLNK